MNRRNFLAMLGGAAALGLTGQPVYNILANEKSSPLPGVKRWGMVIDLRELAKNPELLEITVKACHKAHNVPMKTEKKEHELKWIWDEPFEHAFIEQENEMLPHAIKEHPVLLMCNHCDNPPCVAVCPTKATWRREDGIIMMDWHRCVGCRYCMAACPYGSRSFNWTDPRQDLDEITVTFPTRTKGVVEKCTFCDERLVRGQIPACVEACQNVNRKAMVFGDLNDMNSDIRKVLSENYSIRRKPELGTRPEVFYIIK